jgi:hypothetical protein
LRHFDRAQAGKVRRHELAIEQLKPACAQARDQMRQCNL